jgi:hypothetical protein
VVDPEQAVSGGNPAPRGRVAALQKGEVDPRSLLEAWIEDLAVAAVYDAPTDVIAELGEALELPPLGEAPPVVGPVSTVSDEHAPVLWVREAPRFELPAGALTGVEPTLRRDLLAAVRALFDALRPGLAVVAIRV